MNYSRLTTVVLRNLFRHSTPRKREGERILAAARTLAPNYTTQFSSFPFFSSANINNSNRLHNNLKLKSPQLYRQLSDDMTFCFWDRGEKYKDHFEPGVYVCSKCGYELFSSRQKYNHHSPWPAFTETIHEDSVSKRAESRSALKVSCGKCGNPLGHEFLGDGPKGGSRF